MEQLTRIYTRLPKITGRFAHPAKEMNTVGYMPDRHVIDRHIIFTLPHLSANSTVQLTYAIGSAGGVECEDGHAKCFAVIIGIKPAQRHEIFVGKTEVLLVTVQGITHQAGMESIMSRRHWSVRGKNGFRTRSAQGGFKVFAGGHTFADQFQREKGGVPFVHVKDRWCFA